MQLTQENLEKEINKNNLIGIYLLYGEEIYLLENMLKKMKKSFGNLIPGINYTLMNELDINKLIDNIETPSFGYEKKLIIIKNTELFLKNKNKKNEVFLEDMKEKFNIYVDENIDYIKEKVLIILQEEKIEKTKLYTKIEKIGNVCAFNKLKSYEITNKIKKICNAYNVNIDNKTLNVFVQTCGISMQNSINEIRKLIEYVGKDGEIKEEDIKNLSIKSLDNIIFDLTDCLGNKKTNPALEILNELLAKKEPIQKILIMLYNHFRKIYLIKLGEKYNKNIKEVLKLKPNQIFLINKYKLQSDYFNEKELRKILEEFINLDSNNKIGNIDLNIGLEAILATYCS